MWQAIKRVVFWTYRRGSLEYDLLCLAILAFIFLTPPSVFDHSLRDAADADASSVEETVLEENPEQPGEVRVSDPSQTEPSPSGGGLYD